MAKGRAFNPLLRTYPDSERINAVSEGAEVLYVRLIAQADDVGRYSADPKWVVTRLFTQRMFNSEIDVAEVERRINELVGAGLIDLYEVNGKRYLQMVDVFRTHRNDVRPQVSWPDPIATNVNESLTARERDVDDTVTTRQRDVTLEAVADAVTDSVTDLATDPEPAAVGSERPQAEKQPRVPASPAVLEFPCRGAEATWLFTEEFLLQLEESFPGIDVLAECKKARGYVVANIEKRKTHTGMRKFLWSWLNREANNPRGGGNGQRSFIEGGTRPRKGGGGNRSATNAVARGQRFVPTDRD